MRKFFTLFILSAFLLIPNIGKAAVLLTEHFNQTTETLSTSADAYGNEIAATGWTNISGGNAIYMNNADLTYSGYKSATDGTRCIETMSTSGVKKVACPLSEVVSSGSVFMAAIINLKNYSTTSQTSSTRDYLFSMCNGTSGVSTTSNCYGRLTMQKIAANQFQFGVAKNTENLANISYTGTLEYENTFLVVLEYEFVAGDNNNDIVRLYLNPTKGDKPDATITTNAVSADALDDAAQLKSIIINASSYFKASMLIDEIKVATSWSDLWEAGKDPDPDPDPESVPTPSPTASSITINSASISWSAVDGADSYVLQWKVNGGSYSDDIEIDKDVRSYSMSGLSSNTKYYVRVKTIKGEDASDFAEINFTTNIVAPSPAASSITPCSAEISWENVTGANSYVLQWKVDGGSYSDDIAVSTSRHSYSMNYLNSATTFYVRVKTIIGERASDWSEISFTTEAYTEPITYKGVTFGLWDSESTLPTAGEYYLANNVERTTDVTLSGDLKLCLNGRTFTTLARIIIPDGVTLTLYDNLGGGSISGYYEASPLMPSGLIHIDDGGTLILHEGAVQNLNVDPNDGYLAYAIYNKGNLHVAGNPVITAATADINLFVSKYITLDGKLTNSAPYGVNASGQTITSGWSVMEDADPNVYFVSKKSTHKGIVLNAGEVKLVMLSDLDLNLSESSEDNESKLTAQLNENASLAITRSPLTNTQYNTICLPYSMDDDEMQLRFGEDYDLEEFVSSSIDGDVLNLTFNPVTTLVGGKPYLLKPSIDAPVLAYASVNIAAASPVDQTSDTYISFHGTFNPTELEGGNRNLLFLGADNELLWPATTANIKGFRAYFEVKGGAQGAKRARIVKKEDAATGIENQKSEIKNQKFLKDGQLLILRDNKTYNVLGMEYGK